ncbi:MAG TPA: cation diffusion facilitator family transporter [Terriglobales bacterium]|nr:cation diffusion facilitator family transporter [Terriglobales bacterium]
MENYGETGEHIAMKVSWNTVVVNVALSVFKLAAGIIGRSAAMISDAVHTISDVLSTFIVMIGVKAAAKKADSKHPYGHERFECVAALILSVMLFATGLGIGYGGIRTVLVGRSEALPIPGMLALVAAVVSIVVKEAMYWYTRAAAKKLNSGALMADAWHHRSDALSSIGSFIGIFGARVGYPTMDAAACLVICVFILKASVDIFMDSINKMTDSACDDTVSQAIKELILAQDQVLGVDLLTTRLFGNRMYVDVEIRVNGALLISDGHDVAHAVHDAIESGFENVKHCMVHVNPQP